jgi:hypothetical protein
MSFCWQVCVPHLAGVQTASAADVCVTSQKHRITTTPALLCAWSIGIAQSTVFVLVLRHAVQGKLYLLGGSCHLELAPSTPLEVYDPHLDCW